MLTVVDLLHFHFGINVAVIEKGDVGVFHLERSAARIQDGGSPMGTNLRRAIGMSDDKNEIIEPDQRVTLDFGGRVLSLGTHRQEMHQLDVIIQQRVRIGSFRFGLHALDQIG